MANISYDSILDGITDSCALTEPLSSLIKPSPQPRRRVVSETVTGATGSATTGSNNQDVDVVYTGSSFTTTITIDLKPYQDAIAALKFDGYKDSVYSTTLSSTKATPSVEYKLGINNNGVNIASVGLLGAIATNSNRVVINASKHMAMMFGQEGVAIASPSRVNIDAGETITLAAQESLFIGLPNKGLQYTTETQKQISLKPPKEGSQKGDPTVDRPYEPLVLGIKLANLLEDILFVLKNAQGVDAWSPVRFNATAQAELSLLANRIPEILSTYAYVDGISHETVNQTVLKTIKQAQASTPNLVSPTRLTGSFAGNGSYTNPDGSLFSGGNLDGLNQSPSPSSTPLLKKAVRDQAIYVFNTFKEVTGWCAKYSYNVAYGIKKHIESKSQGPIAYSKSLVGSGGNANEIGHRNFIKALGIHDEYFIGRYTGAQLKAENGLLVKPAKPWNPGDMLNYFPNVGDNFHTQIYTADIFTKGINNQGTANAAGSRGWSTSGKTNYGAVFVYGGNSTVYNVYVYRIKPQYLI